LKGFHHAHGIGSHRRRFGCCRRWPDLSSDSAHEDRRTTAFSLTNGWLRDAPALPCDPENMPISARNQLEGKILEVTLGDIMAHVVVKVGKNQVESVITRRSAKQLGLKKGDKVTVLIKSTEVMLQKD
jgi:molybdopterin-binding protein